jgi:integrase/recombinase XerD
VHPDDEYAFLNENSELGKTEMWYILDAKPDAKLIYGFNKDVSPQILRHSFAVHMINNGLDAKTLQELMGYSALASTQIYENINRNRIKEIYKTVHPRA